MVTASVAAHLNLGQDPRTAEDEEEELEDDDEWSSGSYKFKGTDAELEAAIRKE